MNMRSVIGDITDSSAEGIVSAANTVGVMGKGVAKSIKEKFPWCYSPYKQVCDEKKLSPGSIFVVKIEVYPQGNYPIIIHLTTKDHWKGSSRLEWIISGCKELKEYLNSNKIKSVALPRLGCGFGGLSWDLVEPEMDKVFSGTDCNVVIYERRD
jgi:O-acetyl-ADP-ribose deacetylase (regulator of RNase III)